MKSLLQTLFLFMLPLQFCFTQWTQTDTSLHHSYCLATRGDYLYAGSDSDGNLFVSTDNGDNWNSIDSGFISDWIYDITFSGENMIAAGGIPMGRYGHIYLSTDNGSSWSEVLTEPFGFGSLISNENYVFAAGYDVWYSSDSGITWDAVNFGLAEWFVGFAVSDSKIFVGSADDGVFLTTDNGISWTAVNNGLSSLSIRALGVSGTYIFVVTAEGVFRTSDDGANWFTANSGLPDYNIEHPADFAVIGTNIFVSINYQDVDYNRYSGIYLSTNFGENWNDVSEGLPEEIEYLTALTANETYLFAGNATYPFAADEIYLSPWTGVWRRPLSEMITDVDENISQFPKKYNLFQNYPNPFNPSTNIKYSVAQSSDVVIMVFDVLGNEIEELINAEKPAGTYELTWYAEGLPSGVYFYQLKAGSFLETKKMVLMK